MEHEKVLPERIPAGPFHISGAVLGYPEQFYLEYECRPGRYARLVDLPITKFGRDVYLPLVPHLHVRDGDHPSLDQVAEPACQRIPPFAGVETLAVYGTAGIVAADDIVHIGHALSAAALDHFVINTLRQGLYALLMRLGLEPGSIVPGICRSLPFRISPHGRSILRPDKADLIYSADGCSRLLERLEPYPHLFPALEH